MRVAINGTDVTAHILRIGPAEFPRCTPHDRPIGVAESGTVYHVVTRSLPGSRAALVIWREPDGEETVIGAERCEAS